MKRNTRIKFFYVFHTSDHLFEWDLCNNVAFLSIYYLLFCSILLGDWINIQIDKLCSANYNCLCGTVVTFISIDK